MRAIPTKRCAFPWDPGLASILRGALRRVGEAAAPPGWGAMALSGALQRRCWKSRTCA
jgi:hypothetical protein